MDREAFLNNAFLGKEKKEESSDEYQQDVATLDVVDILVILCASRQHTHRQQKNLEKNPSRLIPEYFHR